MGTIIIGWLSFDSSKSIRNEALRGLPFELALDFDWSTAWVVEDLRWRYPEPRYQALGWIGDRLNMLVFTPRPGAVHGISLRRANRRERVLYAKKAES